jgi:DNA-binding LacI/PurR family transcriptional regulator
MEGGSGMPATLADVARRAGVSNATASRVLNGRRYVSSRARARVVAAARELDYVPNRAARDLSTAQTQTVAFLTHHSQYPAGDEGTFGARILLAVTRALHAAGYDLINVVADDAMVGRIGRLAALRPGRSDGVLALGPAIPAATLRELHVAGRPLVLIDNLLAGSDSGNGTAGGEDNASHERSDLPAVPAVLADNQPAAEMLTAHLVEQHAARRLACLGGPSHWVSTVERVAGCVRAAARAGIRPRVVHARETTVGDGSWAAEQLLDDLPDAVVAVNDAMAIGALHRLAALGVQPRPAVVGFDDIAWARLTNPPLTTVAFDAELIAGRAVARLLEQLSLPPTGAMAADVQRVAGELRIRSSCGCPAQIAREPGS